MNDYALKLYSTMLAFSAAPIKRDEKGQGTLEYLGIVIVAAILVGAVVGALKDNKIGSTISGQIGKIIALAP